MNTHCSSDCNRLARDRRSCRRFALCTAACALLVGLAWPAAAQLPPEVGPQVRVDPTNTGAGNETSIASFDFDPDEVVGTWNDYREGSWRMGVGLSLDGGEIFNDFLVRPPTSFQSYVEGDPMTAFDNRTGILWVGAISFAYNGGVFVARKDPGSASFYPAVMAKATGGADKGWMAAGVAPFNPAGTRLYIAYNEGLLISTDLGNTWTGPSYLGPGLGFLPRVGPAGELYIAYWDWSGSGDGVMLIRSFDGGNTLSSPIRMATRMDVWGIDGTRFPGQFRVAPLTYLAVDPNNGTLYCVYFDTTNITSNGRNVDLYFTRSTDQGTSWTTPVVINGDADPPGDQFFPWLEVDKTGRIHMVFYDTRAVVQNDNTAQAFIEAYYSYSDDAGDTWHEIVLTPAPFNSAYDGFGGSFIGDYLGLAVGGCRAYPCYLSTQDGRADVFAHVITNRLLGDLDDDGDVDLADLSILLSHYGMTSGATYEDGDLDQDGDVDLADLGALLSVYGNSCE